MPPIIAKLKLANDFVTTPSAVVSCQTRYKNGQAYHFLMNFSTTPQTVALQRPSRNLLTDEAVDETITLPKFGTAVLQV